MRTACLVIAAGLVLLFCSPSRANVVIGNWEGTPDGWIDWGTQATITAPKYTYSNVGATLGSQSLQLTHAGWNQNLSIKLQDNGLMGSFFANTQFAIDVTVPASSVPGFAEIFALSINAQTYGFVDQPPVPKHQFFFPNAGLQTATLVWDYAHLIDGDLGNGEIPPGAGWIEFILATNSDADHGVFYFDNARLVPEPASLGILGVAVGLLVRRIPRRARS